MRARGRRDVTQQLVGAMHETLRKLVESNSAMGTHLQVLTRQMGALGQRLLDAEEGYDELDTRVTRLEKKKGDK